jgi:hypothetical protein
VDKEVILDEGKDCVPNRGAIYACVHDDPTVYSPPPRSNPFEGCHPSGFLLVGQAFACNCEV